MFTDVRMDIFSSSGLYKLVCIFAFKCGCGTKLQRGNEGSQVAGGNDSMESEVASSQTLC